MLLHLASHARACRAGEWAIFLDLRRDRYWAAPACAFMDASGQELPAGGALTTFAVSPEVGDTLVRRELAAQTPPRPDVARRCWQAPAMPAGCEFLSACLWARATVRGGRLEAGVAQLSCAKRELGHAGRQSAVAFEAMRPWFPAPYVCLFDSLALVMFAARRNERLDLVIAVRGMPFAAHCWAEENGEVLNDTPEYCAAFTPILRA